MNRVNQLFGTKQKISLSSIFAGSFLCPPEGTASTIKPWRKRLTPVKSAFLSSDPMAIGPVIQHAATAAAP